MVEDLTNTWERGCDQGGNFCEVLFLAQCAFDNDIFFIADDTVDVVTIITNVTSKEKSCHRMDRRCG